MSSTLKVRIGGSHLILKIMSIAQPQAEASANVALERCFRGRGPHRSCAPWRGDGERLVTGVAESSHDRPPGGQLSAHVSVPTLHEHGTKDAAAIVDSTRVAPGDAGAVCLPARLHASG